MVSRLPIRKKLQLFIGLLLIAVTTLSFSGFQGVYSYRGLARSLSRRASEIPLATSLAKRASDLQVRFSTATESIVDQDDTDVEPSDNDSIIKSFDRIDRRIDKIVLDGLLAAVSLELVEFEEQLSEYHDLLVSNSLKDVQIGGNQPELSAVQELQALLVEIDPDHARLGVNQIKALETQLEELRSLANQLPGFLPKRMQEFKRDVDSKYRTLIVLTWVTSILVSLFLIVLTRLFYTWVLRPLQVLVSGSLRVASGDFDHRIKLNSQDEIAELARAMNDMTERFQHIRNDLDQQVEQRTKQVVRSEQLASVGFLAAGIAHEINNPLASIALCAESLEDRVHDVIQEDDKKPDGAHNDEVTVLRDYLRMIQDEAFRCKQITEQLLDFSRLGDVERQRTDLADLIQSVVDMVGHLGKYKEKHIHFSIVDRAMVPANSQEIKQVILNLVTNALDSVERGGNVGIQLRDVGGRAEIEVTDDGCGMTDEVREHLFEPFFTRRRDGQGTGLGLSISYRIIEDHGGQIDVHSGGPGFGATFRVILPLEQLETNDERQKQYQAA